MSTISTSRRSNLGSLTSASSEQLAEVMHGKCDQARLAQGIRDILSLYYQNNETPEQQARVVAMFVQSLEPFSDDCVRWALRHWRDNETRRPTPAVLKQLAMRRRCEAELIVIDRQKRPRASDTPAEFRAPISDEEKAERQAFIGDIMRGFGSKRSEGERRESERHWSETAPADDPRREALAKARREAGVNLP